MGTGDAVAIAALGVVLAETLEAFGLYLRGDGRQARHRWPGDLRPRQYAVVGAFRLALGALATLSLSSLGLLCDPSLAFLAGLSTLKVVEIFFGYSAAA